MYTYMQVNVCVLVFVLVFHVAEFLIHIDEIFSGYFISQMQ